MHRAYAVIRLAIALTPVALLAIWGFGYLRACWSSMLAPGVPVALQFKSPGGVLSFSAASYSFNPRSGFVAVSEPSLLDPSGRTIVSARRADASGIDLFDFTRSALHVHVFGAQGTLVRQSDGQFQLQTFLGKPSAPSHPVPFDVSIDEADVEIIDEVGGGKWSRRIVGRDIVVDGAGSRWLAAANVSADRLGAGPVTVNRNVAGVIDIHTVASNWQLSDIAKHLLATLSPSQSKSVGNVAASGLVVSGPIDAEIAPPAAPKVLFNGSAQAKNVVFRDYRASTLAFTGRVTEEGAEGRVVGSAPGLGAQLQGWLNWKGNRMRLAFGGSAKAASVASLPTAVRKLIPDGVSYRDAIYRGWIAYDPASGVSSVGSMDATAGGYKEDGLDRIAGNVRIGGSTLWAHVAAATYRASDVSGEFAVNWKSRQITGAVHGGKIPVGTILSRFPDVRAKIKGTPSGDIAGLVLFNGPVSKPDFAFRVRGSGAYTEVDLPRPVKIDRALIEGHYHDGSFDLERLRARTPAGSIVASGTVDVANRRLNISVDGRGLDVGDFTSSLTGLASISGVAGGTFDDPRFDGQVEGYDLSYRGTDVELTTARITARPSAIVANTLDVVVGSSQISGNVAIELPSKTISGSFGSKALQLSDVLGEPYAGLVSIQTSNLSGTFDDPHLTVSVSGKDLLAESLQVKSLDADATVSGRKIALRSFQAQTANGLVGAQGSYDFDSQAGFASLSAKNLDLDEIVAAVHKGDRASLAGNVDGSAHLEFAHNALASMTASGALAGVKANGTDYGAGVWNLSGDAHKLSGSAQVSSGTRVVALENASVNLDESTLDSGLVVSNLGLQNIYRLASSFLPEDKEHSLDRLASLEGDVKLVGRVDGKWADPNIVISKFETDGLAYNGVPFGSLTAAGKRVNGLWDISSLSLLDGAATASATGSIDEAGDTKIDGEIHNFDLGKLAEAFPGVPRLGGVVSSSFLASGTSAQPQIRATLDAESVALEGRRIDFGLDLDNITLGPDGFDATGAVTYEGFHGQLVAHVPFTYPFSIPDNAPISAKLTLDQRPLSDLAPYATGLDPKRAEGAVNGSLAVTGVRDALHLSGGVNVRASTIGLRALDPASKAGAPKYIALGTELRDLVMSLGVQDDALTADVAVKSSLGGSVDGKFSSKISAIDSLLDQHTVADVDTWLSSTLSGKLAFNGVDVKEGNKLLTTSFSLGGALTLDGSLSSPLIGGDVDVSNLSTSVPELSSQGGASGTSTIDPKFNVNFQLKNPGRIGTSLANIELTGNGHIGGTLSEMDANAKLAVVHGTLRLPGGTVNLTPGGSVLPTYKVDASGIADAHVPVDLSGESHVTAIRNGDIADRYDVQLDVRGDLLAPEKVVFTATSDPPDLSQDQILALLGRADLLNALGSGTGYSPGGRQLQTAAIGYAVPSLFDPITARLAANVGLDYLSVEYNALDQTSFLTSKNLGYGFSFQARRQVSAPLPGYQLSFDYRLVYHLPTRSQFARRFSLFLGRDELTEWKIGFQYGQRL